MNKILVVCAHPDDETLGCGGTMMKYIANGDDVYVLVMTNNFRSPNIYEYFTKATKILGIKDYKLLDLPDSELERYTRMELSRMVEEYIQEIGVPDIVYTHSQNELSQDHGITFWATLTAFRPVWGKPFSVYSFESPSSSEWAADLFKPRLFVDIKGYLEKKIKVFKCYETEYREYPHPRSAELFEARAKYWGSYCGLEYAEAFEVVREVR